MTASTSESTRTSIVGGLRRSFRAIEFALTTLLLVGIVTLVAIIGIYHPHIQSFDNAVLGADEAHQGLLDQETGLRGYLLTHESRYLQPYYLGQAEVKAGDTAILHANLSRSLLDRVIATRVAEQAWITGWADQASRMAIPGGSSKQALSAFVSNGKALFDQYRVANSALVENLENGRNGALNDERNALIVALSLELVLVVSAFAIIDYERRRMNRVFIRPVQGLLGTIRRIGEGHFETDPDAEGPSEIVELRSGLNEMVSNLASSRDALVIRESQIAEHATKLAQILGLARDVGGSLSLRYVLDAVVKATLRVTGAARVLVWSAEDDGLHLARDSRPAVAGSSEEGVPGELVERVAADGQLDRADQPVQGDCVLAVPLVFGGQVVGVIDLRGDAIATLSEDDVTVLETLASHSASAIAAARLHGATEALSLTDPLTRLSNRRQLEVDLYTECERSMRYSRPLAFIMLDVDHFKLFNDQHGHQRGDEVLAKLGQLLAETIRVTDTSYRYGGEEFAIVARESTLDEAVLLAERLRERIADRFSGPSKSGPITASFGVASGEAAQFDPDALIAAADAALYTAKRDGRDRVVASNERGPSTTESEGSQVEPGLRIVRDDL